MTIPQSRGRSDFRSDINGLRAWAIVAVVLYHFDVPGFGGGFVGVDVFFVISGFLMTRIVVDGLELKQFSLRDFYFSRARRLAPALVVLCAVLLSLGWFALASNDYRTLATHALFSLAFISNLKFWSEGGYFDVSSHEKWLLHTWSLSVEMQFCLVLPLLLMLAWRLHPGRRTALFVIVAGLVVSLASSMLANAAHPRAAFYFMPTRTWEMLCGGLIYLAGWNVPAGRSRWVEWLGVGLIAASVIDMGAAAHGPGWRIPLSVAGTALVLVAARPRSGWTGTPVMQWLGTRSYSLYLWHWPVVVALRNLDIPYGPSVVAAGLLVTLALGMLSFALVERPSRARLQARRFRMSVALLAMPAFAVAGFAVAAREGDGFPLRLPAGVELAAQERNNRNPYQGRCLAVTGIESPSCVYGGPTIRAVVIGDSHADAVATAVAAALPGADGGVLNWSYVGCPTWLGVRFVPRKASSESKKCMEFNAWALRKLEDLPAGVPLIVVNRTTMYAGGLNEFQGNETDANLVVFRKARATPDPKSQQKFSSRLAESACEFARTRPVYLVRPIPEMDGSVPKILSRRLAFGIRSDVSVSLQEYHARNAPVWAAQDAARDRCGVRILDPLPYLCSDGRCYGSRDGRPLYVDNNHLSEHGNRFLVAMFAQVFAEQRPGDEAFPSPTWLGPVLGRANLEKGPTVTR